MKIRNYILTTVFAVCCCNIQYTFSQISSEGVNQSTVQSKIKIESGESANSVRILNGSQQILEVYDVTGKKIESYRIDSADKTFSFSNLKGLYMIKVEKITRKFSFG